MEPGNPIVGGTALRLPAVNSPNFNLQNPAASPTPSWAILQNGLAYFFGLVLAGGTITGPDYIINAAGIFIYSGAPANGNLIGSWAGAAGTDAFGNAFPQGFSIIQGSISGTVFNGTNFILNASGLFFYSGTPALGNLIMSAARVSGTDGLGNAYVSGWVYYSGTGYVRLTNNTGIPAVIFTPDGATHLSGENPQVSVSAVNAGLVNEYYVAQVLSGKASGNSDTGVQVFSASADNTIAPKAVIEFGGVVSAQFTAGQLLLGSAATPSVLLAPSGATHQTTNPQFNASLLNAGLVNEQSLTFFSSGKETSHDDAALQLFSQTADTTGAARAVIEFGGTVVLTVNRNGGVVINGGSTPAATATDATLFSTSVGGLGVVDGLDSQAYATQRRTLVLAANTGLAAAPGTTLFTSTVGVRSYHVHGMILVAIATAAQQLSVNIAPPSGTGFVAASLQRATALVAASNFNLNTLTGLGVAGSLVVGNLYLLWFDAIVNVTGAGALNFIFAGTNAGDITAQANSFVEIEPV